MFAVESDYQRNSLEMLIPALSNRVIVHMERGLKPGGAKVC